MGTFLIVVVVLFVGFYFFEQASKKHKIYCTFRRSNRTKEDKWVKEKSKYVIYRGGKYRVDPKKISLLWWDRGILGALKLGYWVPSLDYRWDSPLPLDPDTFEVTWDTPDTRDLLSSEEEYKDFAKNAAPTSGKKEGGLQRMLPWIALAGVVIIGFLLFQMRGDIAALYQLVQVK